MNIKSYLAQPHETQKNELHLAISKIRNCEVIPARNKDVLIVITETQNKAEDAELLEQLEALKSMKLLTLVSGFNSGEKQ